MQDYTIHCKYLSTISYLTSNYSSAINYIKWNKIISNIYNLIILIIIQSAYIFVLYLCFSFTFYLIY